MSFNSFSFYSQIMAGIDAAGYTTPTPIQRQTIPKIVQGTDVMGLAQTGTGKTAAYALPILQRLIKGRHKRTRALIIAPTRELAEQIHQDFEILGANTPLRSVPVYGGVGIQPQVQRLKSADIVVACPGRLLDHIQRKSIDLSRLEVLVLDEADQMFDMGFFPDIRRILSHLPRSNRQTLLFSATMPAHIRHLAKEILKNPVTVQVAHDAPAATVSHALYPVAQHLKAPLLLKLLGTVPADAVLVFTRTKHRARQLAAKLAKAGVSATSLQGNLSQNQRRNALDGFKSGKFQVLVATDIAARGIDVSKVSHVINFDMPSTPETYIHRIGRTGRAERSGQAFTLMTDDDSQMVKAIQRAVGSAVEQRTLADFDYNVTAPAASRPRKRSTAQRPPRRQQAPRGKTGSKTGGKAGGKRRQRAAKGAFSWLSPRKDNSGGRRRARQAA